MDEIHKIIGRRSVPGVLIFDMDNRLLYFNKEAITLIPDLQNAGERDMRRCVPEWIYNLCKRVRDNMGGGDAEHGDADCAIIQDESKPPYSLRAFPMGGLGKDKGLTHIMVLVERFVEKHTIDFEKAKMDFHLTNRETEVVRFICDGLSNREISGKLFICEYTVKDHIKKVMKKMNVTSRNEVVAALKPG